MAGRGRVVPIIGSRGVSYNAGLNRTDDIRSAREWRETSAAIVEDLRARMLQAGIRTGWRVVGIIRSSTKFADRTGNLRDSVGIPKTIRPADYNLGLEAKPEDQAFNFSGPVPKTLVRVRVGMAYAYFVQEGFRKQSFIGKGGTRTRLGSRQILTTHGIGFMDEGIADGPGIAQQEFAGMAVQFSTDVTIRIGSRRGTKRRTVDAEIRALNRVARAA